MKSVLILETSSEAASLALVMEGEIVIERSFVSDRRHNALLFEPLSEIIQTHAYPQLDAVLVGSGPGSYSGTRVGIAAAQGAALVSGCPTIAIPSLLGTPQAQSGKPCLATGDARRGSYWLARIEQYHFLHPPLLTDAQGLDDALHQASLEETEVFSMEHFRHRQITQVFPKASLLWLAWKNASDEQRQLWKQSTAQPIYLAPPHITASKKITYGQA